MSSNTEFLNAIREVGSPQTLSAGIQLFRQGDPIRDIYLLEKGIVKFIRIETNGQEMITELRAGGSLLGGASVLANRTAQTIVVTLMPCEVYRISVRDFLHLEKTDENFSHELLRYMSRHQVEKNIRYGQLGLLSARARLEQLLMQFMDELGGEWRGAVRVSLPISKQDIAALLAITPQGLRACNKKRRETVTS